MSCSNNTLIWIVLIFLFCGCNGNSIGNLFGCGNDSTWIIIIVLILCCGNGGFNLCESKC